MFDQMREVAHRICGGTVALCAAALVAFGTDSSTRPTHWAILAIAAVMVGCAVAWVLTRSPQELDKDGESIVAQIGEGIMVGRDQHNYYVASGGGEIRTDHYAALKDADKATFVDLTSILPRHRITFLGEHDFGASWFDHQTGPFYEYRQTRNAVEHRFHDAVLEERRRTLYEAVQRFTGVLGQYSGPGHHGHHQELNEKQWTRSHPPGDETYDRYEAHRKELNESADQVVRTYDALVGEARRRIP
jgi:hypothetical protein